MFNTMTKTSVDIGRAVRDGAELAVEEHNRATPGCPATLAPVEADPSNVAQTASHVAADTTVLGVVAATPSGPVHDVQPVFDRAGLPAIFPIATGSDLSNQGWTTFFRTVASNGYQVLGDARFMTRVLRAKAVYVVGDDSPLGQELATAMHERLGEASGGKTLIPQDATKLSDLVNAIKATSAGLVYYAGTGELPGRLLRQLRNSDNTASLVMSQGWPCRQPAGRPGYTEELTRAARGADTAGTTYTCTCLPTEKIPAAFASRYREAFNAEPMGYAAMAYDAAKILLSGLTAGAATRTALRDWVAAYSGDGVGGHYRFTANGDLDPSAVNRWAYTVRGGTVEVKPVPAT